MRKLGMIGGTSWHSTIDYYKYINQMVNDQLGNPPENPPLIIYSQNIALMRSQNWDEINPAYLDISKTLEQAGAEALLICANTPHKVVPFVQPQINIPFIHIADATGAEARRLGLKKLALFGTTPVMEGDFISGRLREKYGMEVVVPSGFAARKVHFAISKELTQGIFREETKQFFLEQMEEMKSQGADGMILGCTELPMLIKKENFDLPLLDTTWLHAKAAVDFILS
jgi:aspartate racemase